MPRESSRGTPPPAAPLAALVLGSVAIGASPILVRLSELGPLATATHRMLWAIPVLWVWARLDARHGALAAHRGGKRLVIAAGLLFAGDLAFWHWSILNTSVANATLFANFAPLIVTLGAWWYLGERISARFLRGMALALLGSALLVAHSARLDRQHILGDGLGMITACFFGTYMLVIARLRASRAAAWIMQWSSVTTCACLLGFTIAAGESLLPKTLGGLAILVTLAWLSQSAGQGMIAYALGHLPAAFSSIVILIEPLTAAVLGWIVIGEPLGALQFVGALGVLAGIWIAREPHPDTQSPP